MVDDARRLIANEVRIVNCMVGFGERFNCEVKCEVCNGLWMVTEKETNDWTFFLYL